LWVEVSFSYTFIQTGGYSIISSVILSMIRVYNLQYVYLYTISSGVIFSGVP